MDLLRGFSSWEESKALFSDLTKAFINTDPTVAVLALEGLNRMEKDMKRKQFKLDGNDKQQCRDILEGWRNGFLSREGNMRFLEKLTIFEYFNIAINDHGDATNYPGNVDLLNVFDSWDACRELFISHLTQELDTGVAVLALEGLHRMETYADQRPFINENGEGNEPFRKLLRTWRNNAPLCKSYLGIPEYLSVPKFLRSLTIFRTLRVPMFVDNCGDKEPLSRFSGAMEPIAINGLTPIAHVTHQLEAGQIVNERRLNPSNNKQVFEGCWFGLSNLKSPVSRYGNKSFEMTLDRLGVTGLHQGEIVSYYNEINVILYATNDGIANFEGLSKPSEKFVRRQKKRPDAFVTVSIVVSPTLLGDQNFIEVTESPVNIRHGPICVRASRSGEVCDELD